MRGVGFSLKGLLIAVSLTAVGLYALVNASKVWTSIIGLVTAIFLLMTAVAAICSRAQQRAFWIGCSIFAWGYLIIADNPLRDNVRHATLVTHVALDALHEVINGEYSSVMQRTRASDPLQVGDVQDDYLRTRSYLRRTGHYVFAWLFGMIGGFTGAYFYSARERAA